MSNPPLDDQTFAEDQPSTVSEQRILELIKQSSSKQQSAVPKAVRLNAVGLQHQADVLIKIDAAFLQIGGSVAKEGGVIEGDGVLDGMKDGRELVAERIKRLKIADKAGATGKPWNSTMEQRRSEITRTTQKRSREPSTTQWGKSKSKGLGGNYGPGYGGGYGHGGNYGLGYGGGYGQGYGRNQGQMVPRFMQQQSYRPFFGGPAAPKVAIQVERGPCFDCGKSGHWRRECTEKK